MGRSPASILYDDDGVKLPVEKDADSPTTPKGLISAGIEQSDSGDKIRFIQLDESGGLVLAQDSITTNKAILAVLIGIAEKLELVTQLIASIAED